MGADHPGDTVWRGDALMKVLRFFAAEFTKNTGETNDLLGGGQGGCGDDSDSD